MTILRTEIACDDCGEYETVDNPAKWGWTHDAEARKDYCDRCTAKRGETGPPVSSRKEGPDDPAHAPEGNALEDTTVAEPEQMDSIETAREHEERRELARLKRKYGGPLARDTERLDWLDAVRPRVGLGEDGEIRLLSREGWGDLLASEPTFRAAIDVAKGNT